MSDYVLVYKNRKIGVIEAKSALQEVGEGVAQAKLYAHKLEINYTYIPATARKPSKSIRK